ncbi:DUF3301 domain-containing protein, partial [Vibrio cidicii]|uniref:DUF3301 domain-containing protein n=1 Tax=Vibrio cidicii TaxID=1763883 RepID=UPI000AB1DF10
MMGDLFAILGLALFCFLFWQQRQQSELAKSAIVRKCEQLDLQLISVAFGAHNRVGGGLTASALSHHRTSVGRIRRFRI